MKKLLGIVVLGLLVCNTGFSLESLTEEQEGKIKFKSIPVITLKQFLNGETKGKLKTIQGTLNFPSNISTGRLPAVVILHGSGGVHSNEKNWAKRLNNIGLATFIVDSNKRSGCPRCYEKHLGYPNIVDAYRALELLSTHPRIDPTRIAVMGSSVGGKASLYSSVKRFQKMWATPGLEFAAYVPFSPECNIIFNEDDVVSDRPIRVFHGALDEWSSAKICGEYVERLRKAGKDVTITIYPDAHHGFESPMDPGEPTSVRGWFSVNCRFIENTELGEIPQQVTEVGFDINKHKVFKHGGPYLLIDETCTTKKASLKYNEEAANQAIKAVTDFFISTFNQ